MHYINIYNALTAPQYSRVGENFAHGETKTVDLNTPKKSLFPFYRNTLEKNWKPIRIRIDIRKKMCMTKTNKNMDSHLYKDVHDKNT